MRVVSLISLLFLIACGQPELTRETRVTSSGGQEQSQAPTGFLGVDIQGAERTCEPISEDTMCTQVFTESDQYAQDCERLGRTAIQCGCHDWICVD